MHSDYQKQLKTNIRARKFLESRGFDVDQIIHKYKIGCSDTRGDYFQNYIVIPLFYNRGLKFMTGRWFKKESPNTVKHFHLPGGVETFYNHDVIHRSDWFILVESPFCAISLRLAGFPAMASLGQGKVPKFANEIEKDQEVFIMNDMEKNNAGLKGAHRQAEILWDYTHKINICKLPLPKSVDKIDVNKLFSKIDSVIEFTKVIDECLDDAEPYRRKRNHSRKNHGQDLNHDWKANYDILDIVENYVDDLYRTGDKYIGFCPFHPDGNTKSFVVYPETNSWYCFGACNKGGDVNNFIQELHGVDFNEAMEILEENFG